MRNAFARIMTKLAQERDDICLLTGDIGNKMFDRYKGVAAERFLNCGIAEANMMSMAAGMALSGLRPVIYTITPFTTTRCLEQIRTGVAYHEAPVIIIGTGSGLSYSELGTTHHSLEDIAILRSIPNIEICAPCDAIELKEQLTSALERGKPTYMRIGKKGEPDIFKGTECLGIGKANQIKEGRDILLLSIGPIITEVLKASELLEQEGINIGIVNLGSLKPLDNDLLIEMMDKYETWVTVEEHYKIGGAGSTIIEWLSEKDKRKRINISRIGIEDHFIHMLGPQNYTRGKEGIDANNIYKRVKDL